MAAKKAHEVDTFLRRPDMGYAVYLVYGPNAGLVNERAGEIARASVPDPADPFQLVRMDGDDIAADPLRLADEANTIGLFGGKRAIWLRAGSRNLAPVVQPVLATPPQDAVVVVEAGDLQTKNPLRAAVEASRSGMALPCFADEIRELANLLDVALRDAKLSIAADAREALLEQLSGDRLLNRRELEKLATYATGQSTVTLADVDAVMADAKAAALDTVIDAVFLGQVDVLDRNLARHFGEGGDAGMTIGSALRHAITLHRARLGLDAGQSLDQVEKTARIFYKRKGAFQKQTGRWSTAMLESVIGTLREAQAQARRNGMMGQTLASRVFLTIAMRVARSA